MTPDNPAPVEADKELERIVYGVAAWRKLPYAPDEVSVKDVVTPAQAMSDLLAWKNRAVVAAEKAYFTSAISSWAKSHPDMTVKELHHNLTARITYTAPGIRDGAKDE